MRNFVNYLFISMVCIGCASTSTLKPYPDQINPILQHVIDDKSINVNREFLNKDKTKDKALYFLEQGRVAQIKGEIFQSQKAFAKALEAIKNLDNKAIYSASGAVAQGSSILVNDNALPYMVQGYERVMLHQFQAFNYLYQQDIKGAGVEIRRANAQQEISLKKHQAQITKVKETNRSNKLNDTLPTTVNEAYAKNDLSIAQLKNSFQNAYSFYFSGLVYELLGEDNDAYIDYKKALEIYPQNSFIKRDVARLAEKLDINEGFLIPNFNNQISDNEGELVIFIENGFILQKEEVKIPITISLDNPELVAVSFPIYPVYEPSDKSLVLYEKSEVIAKSEKICDMNLMAIKALKEKVPALVTHHLLRTVSKALIAKQAQQQLGDLGGILASIYNIFTENADLRSWLSLPSDVQLIRVKLTQGVHELSLLQRDSGVNIYLKVEIKPKSKKMVRVIRIGNSLNILNLN